MLFDLSLTFLADHFFLAFLPPEEEEGLAAASFFACNCTQMKQSASHAEWGVIEGKE
jgi:hypothetical protein